MKLTPKHKALASAIDIWVRQDGVSPDFIANQLLELTNITTREDPTFVAYKKCLNRIEDYFEYRNESKKDREFVHAQMRELVKDIKAK